MKKLLVIEWCFLAFLITMVVLAIIWGSTTPTVPLALAFGAFAGFDISLVIFDLVMIAKTILEIKNKGE